MPDTKADGKERCWRKRTGLEKKLIYGVSALAALAVILLLIFAFQSSCYVAEEECNTQSCLKAAAELLECIDLRADPCRSFDKYACGSFYKNAVKRGDPSPWTSRKTLFENEMKALVVDPIGVNDTNAHIQMKKFYHECMNTTKIENDNNGAFMEAIDELGGWPLVNGTDFDAANFNWVDWYIKAKQMGLPVIGFFDFPRSPFGIFRIRGPSWGMIDSITWHSITFGGFMEKISLAFSAPVENQAYNDLFHFIRALLEYRYDTYGLYYDLEEDEHYFEEATVPETLTIANLTEVCPNIPWLKILNGISGNSSQFDNSSKVHFFQGRMLEYCTKLDALLEKTKPETIANYFILSIIHQAHKYMSREVRTVYEDIYDNEDDRFSVCYGSTEERFHPLKQTIYIRKKTFPGVRKDLFEMIKIIKELFVERLKKCYWMDETSKAMALKKAYEIKNLVGADDDIYNVEKIDKILGLHGFSFTSDNIFKMNQEKLIKEEHRFFETVHYYFDEHPNFFEAELNAFFYPRANMMVIPAPILTSIFYNWKFPAFMNYGAMGSTVGHELMHGFTGSSRKYYVDDDIVDWWTNDTKEAYDKQIQCIIDEYDGIPFKYRLNGTLKLEEYIADFVGADIGYEAYQIWVEKHGPERKLAGVHLTPEQIYWVQTATNFCFRKLDDNEIDYEEEDAHAIPAFRVQGPARHSRHFAEAFNCPVGSFMNPKEKCQIL